MIKRWWNDGKWHQLVAVPRLGGWDVYIDGVFIEETWS